MVAWGPGRAQGSGTWPPAGGKWGGHSGQAGCFVSPACLVLWGGPALWPRRPRGAGNHEIPAVPPITEDGNAGQNFLWPWEGSVWAAEMAASSRTRDCAFGVWPVTLRTQPSAFMNMLHTHVADGAGGCSTGSVAADRGRDGGGVGGGGAVPATARSRWVWPGTFSNTCAAFPRP